MSVLSRQQSKMTIEGNPLESSSQQHHTLKYQPSGIGGVRRGSLTGAVPISAHQLDELYNRLSSIEKNEEIIRIVDESKDPFLFTSDNLIKILEVTTSLKTKIALIGLIGPRLLDPKAKTAYFTGLFRFVEDKNTVEEILKTRANTIQSTAFSRSGTLGRGGGGGGGGGGRGGPTSARSGRGPALGGRLSSMGGSMRLLPTKSIDTLSDTPVISGFDNVLSALDDLHSEKITPKTDHHIPVGMRRLGDDENTTGTSSRNSSIGSYHDADSNSLAEIKQLHQSHNNRERDNASPQTDSEQSTPKRYEEESSEDPLPLPNETIFTNKSPLAMNTNPVSKIASRSSINLSSTFASSSSSSSSSCSSSASSNNHNTFTSPLSGGMNMNGVRAASTNLNGSNEIRKLLNRRSVSIDFMRGQSISLPNSPLHTASHDGQGFSSPQGATSQFPNGRYGTPRRVANEYQQLITAMSSKSPIPSVNLSSTQAANNLNYDLATKCAWALKLSKEDFLALSPEAGVLEDGELRYSYKELLRRNFAKDYGDLIQTELEKYMMEEDFKVVFQKTKAQFYTQVKWRQLEQKKRALLF